MSKGNRNRTAGALATPTKQKPFSQVLPVPNSVSNPNIKVVSSLLDEMIDGREYASIVDCMPNNMDFAGEIKRALAAISSVRKRPIICYAANMVNNNIKPALIPRTICLFWKCFGAWMHQNMNLILYW
jgi:hypothetical protein